MFKTKTIEVAGCPHKPGDVLHIDDERWFVVQTSNHGCWSKVWLEPLVLYLAKNKLVSEAPYEMTIAEYLYKLCDEYEENGCC